MNTEERYVVTCAPKEIDRPYYNNVSPGANTYKFYGVRGIGMLEYYETEAQKYAWQIARMIVHNPEYRDVHRIFGVNSVDEVFKMSFAKVVDLCQKWDDRIKAGDVCLAKRSDGKTEKVVVISEGDPESPDVLVLRNNLLTVLVDKDSLEQTGESRTDELDSILKALQEEEK